MLNESISIPFRLPKIYGGLAQGSGILRVRQEGLILEFEVKDAIFKALRLDSNVIAVPLDAIAAIEVKKGWFEASITIRANSLETLRKVPGCEAGEVRLRISRQQVAPARELVTSVSLTITARDLARMAADLGRARSP